VPPRQRVHSETTNKATGGSSRRVGLCRRWPWQRDLVIGKMPPTATCLETLDEPNDSALLNPP
ncbi:unnamed protein product, partial [Protopolystoma xenopodis]